MYIKSKSKSSGCDLVADADVDVIYNRFTHWILIHTIESIPIIYMQLDIPTFCLKLHRLLIKYLLTG